MTIIAALVDHLISLVGTKQVSVESTIVLVDNGFACYSRDAGEIGLASNFPILSISLDDSEETVLQAFSAKCIIFMLLGDISGLIEKILLAAQLSKSSSLFIFSNILPSKTSSIEKLLTDSLLETLGPVKVSIIYLPMYSMSILPVREHQHPANFECSLLSTPICKDVFPLTLNKLKAWNTGRFAHIKDIQANCIPEMERVCLKKMAHELAAAVVLEYGYDPSKSLYSIGTNSKIVGNTVLTELTEKCDLYSNLRSHQGPSIIRDGISMLTECMKSTAVKSRPGLDRMLASAPLIPASLVLIDRTEDLSTPSYYGRAPLAHRSQNCLVEADRTLLQPTKPLESRMLSHALLDCRAENLDLFERLIFDPEPEALSKLTAELSALLGVCPSSGEGPSQTLRSLVLSAESAVVDDSRFRTMVNLAQVILESFDRSDCQSFSFKTDCDIEVDRCIDNCFNFNATVKSVLKLLVGSDDDLGCLKREVSFKYLVLSLIRIQSITRYDIGPADISEFTSILTDLVISNCQIMELRHLSLFPKAVVDLLEEYRTIKLNSTDEDVLSEKISQLRFEIAETVTMILQVIKEIGGIRTVNEDSIGDDFTDLLGGLQKFLREVEGEEGAAGRNTLGLLARLTFEILNSTGTYPLALKTSSKILNYIDNADPLLKLAKAGLGMIWSSVPKEVDHCPASEETIFMFVIGGISFIEVQQLHEICASFVDTSTKKIVLMSTNIVGPDYIFHRLCNQLS